MGDVSRARIRCALGIRLADRHSPKCDRSARPRPGGVVQLGPGERIEGSFDLRTRLVRVRSMGFGFLFSSLGAAAALAHLSGTKQIVAEAIVASAGVLLGLATTALGSRKRVVVITSCDVIVMSANVFGGPKKALHRSGSEPILLGRKHGRFQEIALGGVSAWTTRSDEAALALRTLHPQGRFGATDF